MQKKILMVCLGNICRSPLAEGILRKLTKEKGIAIEIDSAGMESFHVGEEPDSRTQKNARSHGLDLSSLRARQFHVDDFGRFDRIFVMDRFNYNQVKSLARSEDDIRKVKFILDTIYPGEGRSVPDPYMGGENGFEEVYQMLFKSCNKITEHLEAKTL